MQMLFDNNVVLSRKKIYTKLFEDLKNVIPFTAMIVHTQFLTVPSQYKKLNSLQLSTLILKVRER